MKPSRLFVSAVVALCLAGTVSTRARQAPAASGDRLTAEVLKGLEFRSIGPAIATGRVQDIAIDPKNSDVWYVATAFGGLWKTSNRGTTFTPVFDNGGSFTLCCVVVDPKNSSVVWLGTGENASQRSAHFGDGRTVTHKAMIDIGILEQLLILDLETVDMPRVVQRRRRQPGDGDQ